MEVRFDFALSFSGSNRDVARSISSVLIAYGYKVFIDEEFEHEMIGLDGVKYLTDVYSRKSRYCIVLLSEDYDRSNWAQLERESIQSRELMGERGVLIPVKLTSYMPSWLPASRIYFDLSTRPIDDLFRILRAKHHAVSVMPSVDRSDPATFLIDISGSWTSDEKVNNRMGRYGTMEFRQYGVNLDGSAALVEQHPNGGSIQYKLALHGEIVPAARVVRFIGTLISSLDSQTSRPYSVDSFIANILDKNNLVGKCIDERGLQGELTLIRKQLSP